MGGREPIVRRFDEMEERVETDLDKITMDDLLPLHVFNRLLSDAQKVTHNQWVAKIFKSASVGGAVVGGKAAPRKRAAASPGSASQLAKTKKKDEVDDGMALFK